VPTWLLALIAGSVLTWLIAYVGRIAMIKREVEANDRAKPRGGDRSAREPARSGRFAWLALPIRCQPTAAPADTRLAGGRRSEALSRGQRGPETRKPASHSSPSGRGARHRCGETFLACPNPPRRARTAAAFKMRLIKLDFGRRRGRADGSARDRISARSLSVRSEMLKLAQVHATILRNPTRGNP
jgi:hypothetical protein